MANNFTVRTRIGYKTHSISGIAVLKHKHETSFDILVLCVLVRCLQEINRELFQCYLLSYSMPKNSRHHERRCEGFLGIR